MKHRVAASLGWTILVFLAVIFINPGQVLFHSNFPTGSSASFDIIPSSPGTIRSVIPSAFDPYCAGFRRSVISDFYLNYTSTHLLFNIYPSETLKREQVKYHFAVISAPKNFKQRRSVRATWKKIVSPGTSCQSSLSFYIGKTSDNHTAHWLEREIRENPDDMVLIDFCDAYENLPLKTYNVMHFVAKNLPKVEWVIKLDDDMLPNIQAFVTCFPRVQEPNIGLYGWITIDKVPKDGNKYMIPRQRYQNKTFPPFTHGPAYAIRTSVLPALLDAGKNAPIINLEDVWFTGILAEQANIQRKNVSRFLSMYWKAKDFNGNVRETMSKGLFFHRMPSTLVRKIWVMLPQTCDELYEHTCEDFVRRPA